MTLIIIPVILLVINLSISGIKADTRFFTTNNHQYENNINQKSRAIYRLDSNNDDKIIRDTLKSNADKRNSFIESSTYDTDVLNKFLDEYANKIKPTTDNNRDTIKSSIVSSLEIKNKDENNDKSMKPTTESILSESGSVIEGQQDLNDTAKRNKFYNGPSDDRNGWVTLEAVPWSKSKISKWQANPSSHRPWPETTKWDKPNGAKPWQSDYPPRPQYQNNKPWYDKPAKPQWQDYDQDRPKPPTRPSSSYFNDRYDVNPSQAQKWPPERPNSAWENFSESHRPTSDIITDNRPSNFPSNSNWNQYDQPPKPSSFPSSSFNDRYQDETTNDWPSNNNNNYHNNRYENIKDKPSYSKPHNRPFYSNYEYENHHPPSHPSSGDGEWVLLSTNRGYAKSRQRSMNFDNDNDKFKTMNTSSIFKLGKKNNDDDGDAPDTAIPSMTSKRQVRLTVLPSINGTNTTTSHGGLLEVEETFKTVDQSQREFEEAQKLIKTPMIIRKKPLKNSLVINNNNKPSNSAVLAAVGAGMLPATMAMVLPLMLGRKKRSIKINLNENNYQNVRY
ncbi:uncharacterized protein DDB_G0287625-like isoform X2 [Aphidius gifuensis]|nr:uncharacterized protein DDB_G0287625-like isoform X2 [Aphidius gifuensis]